MKPKDAKLERQIQFRTKLLTSDLVTPVVFNDVARESSVQIIIIATLLLLERGRQGYPGRTQVSHFLKNLEFTLGFKRTVKSGPVLP